MGWLILVLCWPSGTDSPTLPPLREPNAREHLFRSALTTAPLGMMGFRLYETKAGRRYWNIESKFAELHRETNFTVLTDVTAQFFSRKSGSAVRTNGNRGRSFMDRRIVELEGDVHVRSENGYSFTMDQVKFLGESNELVSPSLVRMQGPNPDAPTLYMEGQGLHAWIDRSLYHVEKRVNGRRKLSNARWMHIVSQSGDFFTDEERAVFVGKVESRIEDLAIRSDKLEVKLTEGVETLQASGRVRVLSKGRTGVAERASLEVGTNLLVLEGSARVDDKSQRIEGQKIVLNTEDDRVEVIGAKGNIESDS